MTLRVENIESPKQKGPLFFKRLRDFFIPEKKTVTTENKLPFWFVNGPIGVLAPDSGSGKEFCDMLEFFTHNVRNLKNEVQIIDVPNLPPRIIYSAGSRWGTLETNYESISQPIAATCIRAMLEQDVRLFTIACNTASLGPYISRVFTDIRNESVRLKQKWSRSFNARHRQMAKLIPEGGFAHGVDYFIIDTMTALRSAPFANPFPEPRYRAEKIENKHDEYLAMGTDAYVREVNVAYDFLSSADPRAELPEDTQSLTQEAIWRVKLYNNNDVASVMNVRKTDGTLGPLYANFNPLERRSRQSNLELLKVIIQLLQRLQKSGFFRLILGCTELPIVFRIAKTYGLIPESYFPYLIDPAQLTAEEFYKLITDLDPHKTKPTSSRFHTQLARVMDQNNLEAGINQDLAAESSYAGSMERLMMSTINYADRDTADFLLFDDTNEVLSVEEARIALGLEPLAQKVTYHSLVR